MERNEIPDPTRNKKGYCSPNGTTWPDDIATLSDAKEIVSFLSFFSPFCCINSIDDNFFLKTAFTDNPFSPNRLANLRQKKIFRKIFKNFYSEKF